MNLRVRRVTVAVALESAMVEGGSAAGCEEGDGEVKVFLLT
jgi:hypothetical protein